MKYFIVLSLVLPFCLAIEVEFISRRGTAIKKVEIPSCAAQPCPFVKGTPLNISITVESALPPKKVQSSVNESEPIIKDLLTRIGIYDYRDGYFYILVQGDEMLDRFCVAQPDECPLSMNQLYKINKQLFLSEDDPNNTYWPNGSRNGKIKVEISVMMLTLDEDYITLGIGDIVLDIQAAAPPPAVNIGRVLS